jgi:signal transduction histidine kinase
MTLPSDQNLDVSKLSGTARKMLDLRETVLAEWEKRVRAAFKEARELREPIFIDTIPVFYDNIVQAVSPGYPRANATEGTSLGYAHGSERARLTNYDPEILIMEYQMFRTALIQILADNDVHLGKQELLTINSSIDEAIRESVMAFSAVVAQMREQFIAALTHDMRTPLQAASMAVEIIALTTDAPKIKELARRAVENLGRVDKMAQAMLDTMVFHQGQNLRLELSNFDIMDVVKEVTRSFSDKDGVRCEVMGETAYGWWSQDAMYRSLENLIGNAVKYGDQRKPIRIAFEAKHEGLTLSVHNEGMPIPVEEQEAIFQVFRRSDNATKGDMQGWGVGLPYVRAVVESLGGGITVDSTSERGTTFTITLPLDARPFQSPSNSSISDK